MKNVKAAVREPSQSALHESKTASRRRTSTSGSNRPQRGPAGACPVRDGTYGPHVYHNVLDRAGERLQGRFTYMMGNGGQVVYLMPDADLVVVRFGGRVQLLHSTLYAAWRSLPDSGGHNERLGRAASRADCD